MSCVSLDDTDALLSIVYSLLVPESIIRTMWCRQPQKREAMFWIGVFALFVAGEAVGTRDIKVLVLLILPVGLTASLVASTIMEMTSSV